MQLSYISMILQTLHSDHRTKVQSFSSGLLHVKTGKGRAANRPIRFLSPKYKVNHECVHSIFDFDRYKTSDACSLVHRLEVENSVALPLQRVELQVHC